MDLRRAVPCPPARRSSPRAPVAAPPVPRRARGCRRWPPRARAAAGFETLLELPISSQSRNPLPKTLLQGPVYRPGRAKDLEGWQPSRLDSSFTKTFPTPRALASLRGVDQRRLFVAGQPAVESQWCPIRARAIEISLAFGLMSVLMLTVTEILFECYLVRRGIRPSSYRARRIRGRLPKPARRLR